MARPRGAKDKAPRRTAARKQAEIYGDSVGVQPLDVLLGNMRRALDKQDDEKAGYWAEKAAPYVHAKLASSQVNATVSWLDGLSIDQQRAVVTALSTLEGDAGDVAEGANQTHH